MQEVAAMRWPKDKKRNSNTVLDFFLNNWNHSGSLSTTVSMCMKETVSHARTHGHTEHTAPPQDVLYHDNNFIYSSSLYSYLWKVNTGMGGGGGGAGVKRRRLGVRGGGR